MSEATLLNTEDAAKYIGISYIALRKKIASGDIVPTIQGTPGVQGMQAHQFSLEDLKPYVSRVIRPGSWQPQFDTYYLNKLVTNVEQVESNTYLLTYDDGSTERVSHMTTLIRNL